MNKVEKFNKKNGIFVIHLSKFNFLSCTLKK